MSRGKEGDRQTDRKTQTHARAMVILFKPGSQIKTTAYVYTVLSTAS